MVDKGGYKTEVFGVRTEDWGQTWTDRKDSLPPSKVYLTDNYKETVGTVPTNDWASSVVLINIQSRFMHIHLLTEQQVTECRWHHRQ